MNSSVEVDILRLFNHNCANLLNIYD